MTCRHQIGYYGKILESAFNMGLGYLVWRKHAFKNSSKPNGDTMTKPVKPSRQAQPFVFGMIDSNGLTVNESDVRAQYCSIQ